MARENIHGRLERLEERARPGTCPVCGMRPDAGIRDRRIRVYYGERPEGFDPSERCGGCGQLLWVGIKVVQDEPPLETTETAGEVWP